MWLGIDIGGSKLAFALAGAEGALLAQRRVPWRPSGDPARDLDRVVSEARRLLADAPGAGPPTAVGVSSPGPLDAEAGVVRSPPNLPGWRDVPLAARLRREFGCAVALENDANAAALAEWRARAGRGVASLVFLTLSTGVGAGMVLDGRLYRGAGGLAGEVGHVPVIEDGEPCACGRRGCLEAYVGGAAWTRRLARHTPETSRAAALAGGAAQVRPEHVVAAAREGDALARAELARWNELLGRALRAIASTLAPDVIALGTIASAAGEALCLAPLREQLARDLLPELARAVRLELSALGEALPFHAALAVAERASGALAPARSR